NKGSRRNRPRLLRAAPKCLGSGGKMFRRLCSIICSIESRSASFLQNSLERSRIGSIPNQKFREVGGSNVFPECETLKSSIRNPGIVVDPFVPNARRLAETPYNPLFLHELPNTVPILARRISA